VGVDWLGAVTFSASLFMFVLALIRGNDEGWSSTQIIALFIGSVVTMIAFVVIERRSKAPMLDLTLFRKPTFAGASIVAFALSASMFAMFLYIVLYIQNVLHFSPFDAGLRFLPLSLISFFVAPIAGKLSTRFPARALLGGGLLVVGVGLLLMNGVSDDSEWTTLLPGFIVAGAGIGIVNPNLAQAAIAVVDPRQSGMASGINSTFRQIGIATGIAALGAVFQSRVQDTITNTLAGSPLAGQATQIAHGVASGGVPKSSPELVKNAATHAFVSGLNELFLIGAVLAFVGAVLAFVLVRQGDFVGHAQQSPAVAADAPEYA
jgi:predicted MFS family arabinose efflux permease